MQDKGDTVVSGIHEAEPTGVRWLNPFTGKSEPWYNSDMAVTRQLVAAAERIGELQADIDEIKAMITERNNITTA
jgi:hypothetical protein